MERSQDLREIDSQGGFIDHRIAIEAFTIHPGENCPWPWKEIARLTKRNDGRYGDGQMFGEEGEKALFLLNTWHGPGDPWQARDEFITDPDHGVVRAGGGHAMERSTRPLRELFGQHRCDQVIADWELVGVHGHSAESTSVKYHSRAFQRR